MRARVKNNTVDCGTRCHYGIEIGGLPWYPNATIRGPATVAENTIGGAGFLLNCDVAGVAGAGRLRQVTGGTKRAMAEAPPTAVAMDGTRAQALEPSQAAAMAAATAAMTAARWAPSELLWLLSTSR